MNQVDLESLNGTPVFVSPSDHTKYSRIHGAAFDKNRRRWLFPAYPPFGQLVVKDLRTIDKTIEWSASAKAHVDYLLQVDELVKNRVMPPLAHITTKPFDHQVEGLAYLYHHPRFALFWDPGCGKTRVLVDLKRQFPDKRMLVIGPKVTVSNWVKEVQLHAGTSLKTIALRGTQKQKRKAIERYKEYDVVVCSYGTARNLGLPQLHRSTVKAISEAQKNGFQFSKSGVQTISRSIRKVSDPERQWAYVLAWVWGASIAEVCRTADAEAALKPQWLEDVDYDIIVADESHNLQDVSSGQTKACLALSRKAGRRYVMSGTPSLGDPRHLYAQMKFLSPAIIPEEWFPFCDMFLTRSPWNKRIVTGFKNLNVLNGRVQRVAIRKRKDECLDLPDRRIIDVPFELSPEQQHLYNVLVEEMAADLGAFIGDPTGSTLEVQNAATLLNKLAQVTSGFVMDKNLPQICNGCPHLKSCVEKNIQPYTSNCQVAKAPPTTTVKQLRENPKLEALNELLDTILAEETNKTIVWGVYRAELDAICAELDKRNIGYVRVDGSTGGNVQTKVDRFNEDKDCRVYVGQIATGIGITLNAATYMIYYSIDWSLATYLQSIDRNYRAGQTKKVTVYRLLGEGTVDLYKAKALDEKKDISAVLTNKLACATCPKRFECLAQGVELFDPGCIYQRGVKRTVAHAQVIK
jgi:SNF2 family DNA or RNA helicase